MGWAYEHLYDDLVDAIIRKLNLPINPVKISINLDEVTKQNLMYGKSEAPIGTHTCTAIVKSNTREIALHTTYEIEYVVKVMPPADRVDYDFEEHMHGVEVNWWNKISKTECKSKSMPPTTVEPEAPECNKMLEVQNESQAIGEFLEWLQEKGITLCTPHEHNANCYDSTEDFEYAKDYDFERGDSQCILRRGEFMPYCKTIEEMLAEFFNIDLKKVEEEKEKLLNKLRQNS